MRNAIAGLADRTCEVEVNTTFAAASAAALARGTTNKAPAAARTAVACRAVFAISVPSSPGEAGKSRENWHGVGLEASLGK